jgi:hypothetical protein
LPGVKPASFPRRRPPPLPSTAASGSLLRLIPPPLEEAGQAATAVAPLPELVATSRPAPAAAPQPAPIVVGGWPLAVALLGGVSLALASALVMVLREHRLEAHSDGTTSIARPEAERPPRRTQLQVGPPEIEREPELPPPLAEEGLPASLPVITTLPAVEVRGRRARTARPPETRADAAPPALGEPPGLLDRADDRRTALAAQILRRNRASLLACDRLAERRGELLRSGSRAEFRVRVDHDRAVVQVSGQGLSLQTLACYRSVASEWRLPQTGAAYSTVFSHVH